MPFFISLTDSTGLSWANGPLHSGGGGPTACLSQTNAEYVRDIGLRKEETLILIDAAVLKQRPMSSHGWL